MKHFLILSVIVATFISGNICHGADSKKPKGQDALSRSEQKQAMAIASKAKSVVIVSEGESNGVKGYYRDMIGEL